MNLRIKKFLDRGVGQQNTDDDKCAKMPFFSYIRRLNKCVCMLFIQINC